VTEIAEFGPASVAPPTTYSISLHETTGLATGTVWTADVSGHNVSSPTAWINVSDLSPNTYKVTFAGAEAPDDLTEYTPTVATLSITISTANASREVSFTPAYWVTISATGPGTAAPSTGFVDSGSTVLLSATPTGTAVFLGWVGSGSGSYSGTNSTSSITLVGPVTEVASFAPAMTTPSTTTTPASSTIWSNPAVWAGLAVVGLVVGLAGGLVIARSRRPPNAPSSAEVTEPSAPDGGAGDGAPPEEASP